MFCVTCCVVSFHGLTHGAVKGVEELVNGFEGGLAAGYLACLIDILYFGTVYALENTASSTMWKESLQGVLADYAYVVSPPVSRYK